jgi:hypothetical protein
VAQHNGGLIRAFTDARVQEAGDACRVDGTRVLEAGLGKADPLWRDLTDAMDERYGIEPTLIPASGTHGPEYKYRKAGRTLVSLAPRDGGFTALVVLGAAETKKAFELDLGNRVRRVLDEATQYHDGRWLYVPVKSKRDVRDLISLIALKRRPAPRS